MDKTLGDDAAADEHLAEGTPQLVQEAQSRSGEPAESQGMLRAVDFRYDLAKEQEQEGEDDSHKKELHPKAIAESHDLQEEIVQQGDDGDVDKIIADKDSGQEALVVLPEAEYLGIRGMSLLLNLAQVGGRQTEIGDLAGRDEAGAEKQQDAENQGDDGTRAGSRERDGRKGFQKGLI